MRTSKLKYFFEMYLIEFTLCLTRHYNCFLHLLSTAILMHLLTIAVYWVISSTFIWQIQLAK